MIKGGGASRGCAAAGAGTGAGRGERGMRRDDDGEVHRYRYDEEREEEQRDEHTQEYRGADGQQQSSEFSGNAGAGGKEAAVHRRGEEDEDQRYHVVITHRQPVAHRSEGDAHYTDRHQLSHQHTHNTEQQQQQ